MFIVSVTVLATCKWLLALCRSINLNLNLLLARSPDDLSSVSWLVSEYFSEVVLRLSKSNSVHLSLKM